MNTNEGGPVMPDGMDDQTTSLPTAQQPPVSQPTAQQPVMQQPIPTPAPNPTPKHSSGSHPVRSALMGLLGGVVGAAAVTGALVGTGVIGSPVTTGATTSSSQSITINPSDTDTSIARAVSAKCLPSVASLMVTTSSSAGIGSGVILDTDGNILTNYHVIEGAQTISVTIEDKSYDGVVVGSDPSSDLAVVKVDLAGASVTPIEVGDSSDLIVGDWVMSVGSPFGLDQSVAQGIVSSVYRSTMMSSSSGNAIYTNLIQTDAAINPGNSGGALVDDEGKLVGINSIIESYSGSSSGVGFAIPSNYAVEVAKTIIAGKTVAHPQVGVTLGTVTAQVARRYGLSVNQGAYISSVSEGSAAAAAGLKEGDVITQIGDDKITTADAVILAVRSHSIGETVKLTYVRGTDTVTVDVTLGSDEATQATTDSSAGSTQNGSGGSSGSGSNSVPNSGSGSGSSNGYGYGYGYDLSDLFNELMGNNSSSTQSSYTGEAQVA